MLDFGPTTTQLADLIGGITDDQFDACTPCENYTVGDLIDHVNGLNECVIHGWDVSRATGRPYDADPTAVAACIELLSAGGPREGIFGPVVEVDGSASELDRLIGLSGRDPAWTAGN